MSSPAARCTSSSVGTTPDAPEIARRWTGDTHAAAPGVRRDEQRDGWRAERRGKVDEPRVDADGKLRPREQRRKAGNERRGGAGTIAPVMPAP
jgi:hypothetical protein